MNRIRSLEATDSVSLEKLSRMKFRKGIFLFILAILITAWLTRPGTTDFDTYRASHLKKDRTPPIIESTNGIVFSLFTVSHFETRDIPSRKPDGRDSTTTIVIPREKESFLGLFGRFWKLN